jgi:hypothetical protein
VSKPFSELTIDEFGKELDAFFGEMASLLIKKRQSYGPHNLSKYGELGVVVRTGDKLERLNHMIQSGLDMTAVEESREDAWMDIVGYGALGVLIHRSLAENGKA